MTLTLVSLGNSPVTLDEAKRFLRVDTTADDLLLQGMINAASQQLSDICGRAWLSTTFDYQFNQFGNQIVLPVAPLQTVTYIKYYDSNSVLQTLGASEYRVFTGDQALILPVYGGDFPDSRGDYNDVTVRFVAGDLLATSVAENIKQAVMLYVAEMYINRMPSGSVGIPGGVLALLGDYVNRMGS